MTTEERLQLAEARLEVAEEIIAALRPSVSGGVYLEPGDDLALNFDEGREATDLVDVRCPHLSALFRDWIRLGGRTR